jgi:hypothetical protein
MNINMEHNNTITLLNEGAVQDFVRSIFGKNFKTSVGAASEGLLNKALTDVVSGGKKFTISSLRKTPDFKKALVDLTAEASRVKYGKSFDELVKFDKNAAQKLINDLQTGIEKEISNKVANGKNLIDADVKASQRNLNKVTKDVNAGKATAIDLKSATSELKSNVKTQTKWAEAQKTIAGMDKMTVSKMQKLVSEAKVTTGTGQQAAGGVKGSVNIKTKTGIFTITKEQLSKFPGKVKTVVVNNKIISGLAALGLTAAAIYAIYKASEDTSVVLVDESGNTPKDGGNTVWGECLNDLIASNGGKLTTTNLGSPVIVASPTEKYPKGLVFYSNNRVQNVATKDKGTWSCKGSTAVVAESVNNIVDRILKEKLLSEQFDQELSDDVNDMIDWLDFPVTQSGLIEVTNKLKKYVSNGKGKTLLDLYKRSGLMDETLRDSLKGVFITDAKTQQIRDYAYKLISQIENGKELEQTNTTSPRKVKINEQETEIDITWDKDKKAGGGTPIKTGGETTNKKKKFKSKFHDCESKDFPLEFGCKSTKIAEIQKCLGVADDGKLGKNTMKAMVDNKFDTSRGLSEDVYNAILKACNPRNLEPVTSLKSKGLKLMDIASPKIDLGKFNQIIQMAPQPIDLYKKFKEEGWIVGDTSETSLEDGTVIPPSNRVKYKGPDLDETLLSQLDSVITGMGYERIKQKLDKRYGDKYVWSK